MAIVPGQLKWSALDEETPSSSSSTATSSMTEIKETEAMLAKSTVQSDAKDEEGSIKLHSSKS